MKLNFKIIPFKGPLPLEFGMSASDVQATLGVAGKNTIGRLGEKGLAFIETEFRLKVTFDPSSGGANHFGFVPPTQLTYLELDLFGDPNAWKSVVRLSADCHECVGFIHCCDLGLRLSGFHDGDADQLGVSLHPEGDYEKLRSSFKPFVLSAEKNERAGS
jgi:hypothetical protein